MFNKELFINTYKLSLKLNFGKTIQEASNLEKYHALSEAIMSKISTDWNNTRRAYSQKKQGYYFSAEFLVGRSLHNNLVNLLLDNDIKETLDEIGITLDELEEQEEDAALGNGGLGRLAACFMESAATMDLPLMGYGVRYSEGILKQSILNGFQVEHGDNWTKNGDPWSLRKESESQIVQFKDMKVKAVPYDMPIIGYKTNNINTLRLWQSEAILDFDFQKFNAFKYDESVEAKNRAEDITRVLYPNDEQRVGKVLRLRQQYFFCSASIKDIIAKHLELYGNLENFEDLTKIQLNDTHPVIAISELIRILVDEHDYEFIKAMKIAKSIFSYTNHTILQEALEKWNEDIVEDTNPRNLEIIKEIENYLLLELKEMNISREDIEEMRILKDGQVRMANLGIYLSHTVNGVAQLHTNILKENVLNSWFRHYPEKFQNKTNGITPRRWLVMSNPELSSYITELLGHDEWITDLPRLKELEQFVDDEDVLKKLLEIKGIKKQQLADYIYENEGIKINPNSIFDIQVKRIHEYKRQLMNALHIVYLYQRLKENPNIDILPRTFIFGGKAAPGYFRAKAIIKFINEIARVVNNDLEIKDKIKVVFVQNYRVSYAEKIFPAADVSEQISTAGKEASGTGNMKFMLNATPTIGTYDGANVEIVEEAGFENNFIFGARVEEINRIKSSYSPMEIYLNDREIRTAVDTLMNGIFKDEDTFMLLDIFNGLLREDGSRSDRYFVLKDMRDYIDAQNEVDRVYRDRKEWAKKCLYNLANSGKFSSDRTIGDYAKDIWEIEPNKIEANQNDF
ncbi:MAG: glycogen/starch/alpha-glucan phosphorylase [Tissierellia bacterium]|nr:glycogen/starch/alpha-glucan phosphorylase [Tissierellia bacterium]